MGAPVDIRAIVTVNGIRSTGGSISDSYLMEAGLVTTTGEVELVGAHMLKPGQSVTVRFQQPNGASYKIPRYLRVLSCAIDPFGNTTKVSLGCSLEYKREAKALPSDEGVTSLYTSQQLNCLNDYEWPPFSDYPPPIYASTIGNICASKLNLGLGPPTLMTWYLDEFRFDQTYFDILNNIALSESYIGHAANGPSITWTPAWASISGGGILGVNDIIQVNSVNSGEKVADGAICKYTKIVLKPNEPQVVEAEGGWNSDYTEQIQESGPREVSVTGENGSVISTGTYTPYTKTIQEFGEDLSWDSDTCVIYSSAAEKPDLSDRVIRKYETNRLCLAEVNERYAAAAAQNGLQVDIYRTGDRVTETWYEYDDKANVILETEQVSEPFWALAGKMNFNWYKDTTNSIVLLPNTMYVVGRKTVQYEYIYPEVNQNLRPDNISADDLFKDYVAEPSDEVLGTVTRTTEESHPLYFTSSQHAKNLIDTDSLDTENLLYLALRVANLSLIESNRDIKISNGRTKAKTVWRPKKAERTLKDMGVTLEESSEIATAGFVTTSAGYVEYSLPYQDMDYVTPDGDIVPGNADSQARQYARTQLDLRLGNRYGINVQAKASSLLVMPGGAFSISAGGVGGMYKANGTTWTWDSSGIIASTDGLLVGGHGSGG